MSKKKHPGPGPANKNRRNVLATQLFQRAMDVGSEHRFVQLMDGRFELIHVPTMARYKFVAAGRKRSSGQASAYRRTSVMVDGRKQTLYLHRLICTLFNGPPPSGFVADHIDRNRRNNSPENLRWVSRSENVRNSDLCDLAAVKRELAARKRESLLQGKIAAARRTLDRALQRVSQ